jgi:hypothetical protein
MIEPWGVNLGRGDGIGPESRTMSMTAAQSAESAEPTIFKIPREIAGIIARFSFRFAIDNREDHRAGVPSDDPSGTHH